MHKLGFEESTAEPTWGPEKKVLLFLMLNLFQHHLIDALDIKSSTIFIKIGFIRFN